MREKFATPDKAKLEKLDSWSQALSVVGEDAREVVQAFLEKHMGGELHPHIILSALKTEADREFVKHFPKPKRDQ